MKADILETAATWYVDLKSVSANDPLHDKHQQWLQENSLHQQAWKRVEKLQKTLKQFPTDLPGHLFEDARNARRQAIKALTLILVVGTTGLGLTQRKSLFGLMADYRTGVGERQEIKLADGSRVQLNTDTTLNVDFDAESRTLKLRQGEMLITTAADSRPFRVQTLHGVITALGTRFQVRSDEQQTQVMVYEHAVEIAPKLSSSKLALQAGQQVRFTSDRHLSVNSVPANTDSWINGILVVSDWRLDQFIKELKRYHHGKLACDAAVADLRISGSFYLGDTNAVLKNLTATLPVKISYFTRFWATVEPV